MGRGRYGSLSIALDRGQRRRRLFVAVLGLACIVLLLPLASPLSFRLKLMVRGILVQVESLLGGVSGLRSVLTDGFDADADDFVRR